MNRQERIEKGFEKTVTRLNKMQKSRNMNYVKDRVKISDKLTLKIECCRNETDVYKDSIGSPYGFQVYAVVNGDEVDCTSDHGYIERDIKYLLNCYL